MKNSATTLRNLVMDNALSLGRLNREQLGEDYSEMTTLYRNALDALTLWASKDYAHTSCKEDADPAFEAVKAILAVYATDESRIIIDNISMRTLRDCATKPKRLYSAEYTAAHKEYKKQTKVVSERYNDLMTLGAPEFEADETLEQYFARVRESGVNTVIGEGKTSLDMLELYVHAVAVLAVKKKAVENIKAAGNWTWRRPVAVNMSEFADLVENYIADCLMDGYNIKTSKQVRDEYAAARKAAAEAKKGA